MIARGSLIEIGDRHLEAAVCGAGGPVVVFENGAGSPSLVWWRVVEELARTNICVTYNRAGIGKSDPGPFPRDGAAVSADLAALLRALSVPGPVVVVAHSSGALYARVFQASHKEDVAALVLIDPVHEDVYESAKPFIPRRFRAMQPVVSLIMSTLDSLGLVAVLARRQTDPAEPTDPAFLDARRSFWSGRHVLAGSRAEARSLPQACEQVRSLGHLGEIPLVVVSAGEPRGAFNRFWSTWLDHQDKTAALSMNALHLRAEGAGHFVHEQKSETVITAIRKAIQMTCS